MKSVILLPSFLQLRERFNYDPETGVITHRQFRKGSVAGYIHKQHGYRIVKYRQVGYLAHRIAFKWMTGVDPFEFDIDHEDGDTSNNKWSNLRLATRSDNCTNRPVNRNNRLGLKGVYYVSNGKYKKFRAEFRCKHIGYYDTPEEAHQAYLQVSTQETNNFNVRAYQ